VSCDDRPAILAIVIQFLSPHRFCPDFVTELNVKIHDFLGALFIGGEAAFPALSN
jgi:hypothetical protein